MMARTGTEAPAAGPPGARALGALRRWIENGRLPGGARLPAEQTLAEELDVSRGTVRGALDKLEQEGLLKRLRGRGCVVVRGAGASQSLMSRTVALLTITPQDAERYRLTGWMEAVDVGAVEAIAHSGLHSLTLHPSGLDDAGVERVLADPPLGMLVSHAVGESDWGPPVMARLADEGVRLVVNGDRADFAGYDRVVSDHETGARELTNWLVARGRRRILRVWTAAPDEYWMQARDKGYEKACRAAGIEPLPAAYVKGFFKKPEPDRDSFEVQTRQFAGYLVDHLGKKGSVDAIMATTDPEAFPIAAACRLLGRRPNEDVEIVGYDRNWATCPEREWEPARPLVTVDKLNHGTGEEMVKLLLDRVRGRLAASSGDAPRRVSVRPKLVVVGQRDENGHAVGQ